MSASDHLPRYCGCGRFLFKHIDEHTITGCSVYDYRYEHTQLFQNRVMLMSLMIDDREQLRVWTLYTSELRYLLQLAPLPFECFTAG